MGASALSSAYDELAVVSMRRKTPARLGLVVGARATYMQFGTQDGFGEVGDGIPLQQVLHSNAAAAAAGPLLGFAKETAQADCVAFDDFAIEIPLKAWLDDRPIVLPDAASRRDDIVA